MSEDESGDDEDEHPPDTSTTIGTGADNDDEPLPPIDRCKTKKPTPNPDDERVVRSTSPCW